MLTNLLDTHILIWFLNGDEQLSFKARQLIEADGTLNIISIASIWEIAIKISVQKLQLAILLHRLEQEITEYDFEILPVSFADTLTVSSLPFHHRDPFDRIIIAQAMNNSLTILTKDAIFSQYTSLTEW